MATLQVTNLQNTAATVTNVSLLADGSTTIVLNSTGASRTGGLRYNAGNLEVYTSGGVWVAAGGGSGTVTGVTASAPLASSGGAAPNISLTGTIPVLNGGTGATTVSGAQANLLPAQTAPDAGKVLATDGAGVLSWTAAGGTAATLAEAAAGTTNTKFSSPQTAVPKDASGMTGAAILPSGTNAQRAAIATPTVGMQRYNTDKGYGEVYTGPTLGWQNLAYVSSPSSVYSDVTVGTGAQTLGLYTQCNNFTVTSGAVITPVSQGSGSIIVSYGNVTINASTWNYTGVGLQGPFAVVTSGSAIPVKGNGYGAGQATTGSVAEGGGLAYVPQAGLGGSSGGGTGTPVAGNASSGGNGGGYIIIRCYGTITFNGAVVMNAAGGNSVVTGNGGSGGSGGSGGIINIHSSLSITAPATVTFNVSGGSANAGAYAYNGHGGGGGGWVILEAPSLTDSSTKNLTGGSGSPAGVSPNQPGVGGGGYAGAGGNAGAGIGVAGSPGGTGIFATSGSIL